MNAEIVISVEIDDGKALHRKAGSDYCISNADGLDPFDEAIAMFGSEKNPDLAACLRHLYDVNHGEAGVRATACEARVDDGTAFRVGRMVNVSVEHITASEMKRINEAFGMEECGTTYRAFEDIEHDGLYMSPKDHGFIVRLPGADLLDEKLRWLSPEMRGILELAAAQGATRIEFDADEEPIEALPIFQH